MVKYNAAKCEHCGVIYNGANYSFHSCKEHREHLEKEIRKLKDGYLELWNKYQTALDNCTLPDPVPMSRIAKDGK